MGPLAGGGSLAAAVVVCVELDETVEDWGTVEAADDVAVEAGADVEDAAVALDAGSLDGAVEAAGVEDDGVAGSDVVLLVVVVEAAAAGEGSAEVVEDTAVPEEEDEPPPPWLQAISAWQRTRTQTSGGSSFREQRRRERRNISKNIMECDTFDAEKECTTAS